jgi:hypothetical protein
MSTKLFQPELAALSSAENRGLFSARKRREILEKLSKRLPLNKKSARGELREGDSEAV